jgi:hypothetical protein
MTPRWQAINWRAAALLAGLLLATAFLRWWLINANRPEVQPPASMEMLDSLGDEALRNQVFGDLHARIVWQGYGWSAQNPPVRHIYAIMITEETSRDPTHLVQWIGSASDPAASDLAAAYRTIGNMPAAEAILGLAAHVADQASPATPDTPPPMPGLNAETGRLVTAYRKAIEGSATRAMLTTYIRAHLAEVSGG